MLKATAVVTGGVMIEVYRQEGLDERMLFPFPFPRVETCPGCGAVKSGRTPMTFEAFQLLTLPLLLTLQKFVEDCTYKGHPNSGYFKCGRNRLSDCRTRLIILSRSSIWRTMLLYRFLSAGSCSAMNWSSPWS